MSALRRKSQSKTAYFGLRGAADAFSPAHSAAHLDARPLIRAASDRGGLGRFRPAAAGPLEPDRRLLKRLVR
jgi:hypothetical protein